VLDWIFVVAPILGLASIYISFSPTNNAPEKVFRVNGEQVMVGQVPFTRLKSKWGKSVHISNIKKVQRAKRTVTLFTASNHAIDIHLTLDEYVEPVFLRAKALFKDAEFLDIAG